MDDQLVLLSKQPSPDLILPVVNGNGRDSLFCKPKGGIWTSTYVDGRSDWLRWATEEWGKPANYAPWWLLIPRNDAHVLHIDSLSDLRSVISMFPRVDSLGYPCIDYEAAAQDCDAIHLTYNGQWATRMTHPENLYGWDCESTIWFRWCFTHVRQIPYPA